MIEGIEHVGIYCSNSAELTKWYSDMFDFRVVYENGRGTYFLEAPDGSMLEMMQSPEDAERFSDKKPGLRHLALKTPDFENSVAKLKAAGVEIVTDVSVSLGGAMTFFFRDPEGNVLHLIYREKPLYTK